MRMGAKVWSDQHSNGDNHMIFSALQPSALRKGGTLPGSVLLDNAATPSGDMQRVQQRSDTLRQAFCPGSVEGARFGRGRVRYFSPRVGKLNLLRTCDKLHSGPPLNSAMVRGPISWILNNASNSRSIRRHRLKAWRQQLASAANRKSRNNRDELEDAMALLGLTKDDLDVRADPQPAFTVGADHLVFAPA